jgi:hypothetical protein
MQAAAVLNPGQVAGFKQTLNKDFTSGATNVRIPSGDGFKDCPASKNPYDCAVVRDFFCSDVSSWIELSHQGLFEGFDCVISGSLLICRNLPRICVPLQQSRECQR